MFKHRPVLVPADARAGVVADQQGLFELLGRETRESGGPSFQRLEPIRERIGRREPAGLEIIAPAERSGRLPVHS